MVDDKLGEALILARNAEWALLRCDTTRAKKWFVAAADICCKLATPMGKSWTRNALLYTGAVFYFNGGDYKNASMTANLVPNACMGRFSRDLDEIYEVSRERLEGYPESIIKKIDRLEADAQVKGHKHSWTLILEILRDHPYALSPLKTTNLRIVALRHLGREEEASLFLPDFENLK